MRLLLFDFRCETEELAAALAERERRVGSRKQGTAQERRIGQHAWNWLRCDMLFRKDDGGYAIAEVKQAATGTNAEKGRQQVAGYAAVVLDNIMRRNTEVIARGEGELIRESVEGYLVANEIDEATARHLARLNNRRAVVISREDVDDFFG